MSFQSPMDLMNTEPERILTPYLGRRAYGGLALVQHSPTDKERAAGMEKPGFALLHSGVTGNDYYGMLRYQLGSGEYMVVDPFDNIRLTTPNSDDVLAFLQALPQLIKKQREADLVKDVHFHKANGVPLEMIIERMRMYAKIHPEFGPTDWELKFHEDMCTSIHAENPFNRYYREIQQPSQ